MAKICVGLFVDGTDPAIVVKTFPGKSNTHLTDLQAEKARDFFNGGEWIQLGGWRDIDNRLIEEVAFLLKTLKEEKKRLSSGGKK